MTTTARAGSARWVARRLRATTGYVILTLACAAALSAQTSSRIEGTITSEDGEPLPGVAVQVQSSTLSRSAISDLQGRYRVVGLVADTYTVTASLESFATESIPDVRVAINSTATLDIQMQLGSIEDVLTVSSEVALLETTTSDTGGVVTPDQIETLPVNGRDYLDLMQLVPGVTVNRQADKGSDNATPILGERAGNAIYLLDGMPNRNEFGSGAASQFNQDTIQEFEVITGGFKAEFGHGSGGVVNVLTKSGGNQLKGLGFVFLRDDSLDSSNSLDAGSDVPNLERQNFGVNLGGALIKDKLFLFGSAESIEEDRQLNFTFPPATPDVLRTFEAQFDDLNTTEEIRLFLKLSEQIGDSHTFNQQISYNDAEVGDFLPLSAGASLPSTRNDLQQDRTMLGLRELSLFGEGSPYVFEGYLQLRDDSDASGPSHPDAGPSTLFNIFSSPFTFGIFGDLGQVAFGNGVTPSQIDQEYLALGPSLSRIVGNHELKVGFDFLNTQVDGQELSLVNNQLFATEENFLRDGPVNSGVFTLTVIGAQTPEAGRINLDNDYFGIYVQDDWRIGNTLTLNLGLRYDRDSEFDDTDNFSPRFGFAWTPSRNTVVRGSWGRFYDRFRLGLVRNVPDFGGADIRLIQDLSYPQLFYNTTTIAPVIVGLCINPVAPHAAVAGTPCLYGLPSPHFGFDFLNNIVAPGRDPIPPETVVNMDNILDLSGLSPDEYLSRVNASVPLPPGFSWYWGPFGALTHDLLPAQEFPIQIDPAFDTPHTDAVSLGIQHQFGRRQLVAVDYHHKDIKNILGVRETNLEYISRVPGFERTYAEPFTEVGIRGFGPWFEGEFEAVTVSYTRRMSDRFTVSAHYTHTDATDNLQGSNLGNGAFAGAGSTSSVPNDSFVGVVPEITDPTTGQNNLSGPFTAANGNLIEQAGTFHNGPDLDRGNSPLALENQFVLFGLVQLPLDFQISAIFRATSGFYFSRGADQGSDPDGNINFGARDLDFIKNSFQAPSYQNLDLRVAKFFDIGRLRASVLVEFFNVFNEQNAASVEGTPGRLVGFGQPLQVLPGREGQVGFRLEW